MTPRRPLLLLLGGASVLVSGYVHYYLYFKGGYRDIAPDSFAGLRALLVPAAERRPSRRRRRVVHGMEETGRWSLVRSPLAPDAAAIEHVGCALLCRPLPGHAVPFSSDLNRSCSGSKPCLEFLHANALHDLSDLTHLPSRRVWSALSRMSAVLRTFPQLD